MTQAVKCTHQKETANVDVAISVYIVNMEKKMSACNE